MNIENLSVCEIGTLYLLQKNAKKGLLETTSLVLPELLKVSRMSALKFLNGLEKGGFVKTQRTLGKNGKLKIFIANYLNFRQLEQPKSLNFRQLKNAPEKAVCIGAAGRNSYENLNAKNNSALQNTSSFPLNKPPINYNLTNQTNNKIKTTKNICAPTRNEENLLFKQEKPSFPYFEGAGVLKEIVIDFFNYRKKDLKKPIKTQRGLDRLINRLKNLAGANVYLAKMICEQSKDHEWQDVFELKKETAERFMEKAKKEEIARTEEKRKKFIDSLFGGRK
ncbi:MAG: hypothetical protein II972_01770 [Elusimicrobiaceae bacterium]|nr:hypothetical protein [Elusimicrobiaceae bacterium]